MIAWHCNAKTYQNFIKLKETRPSREVAAAYYRTDIDRKSWILTSDRIVDSLYISSEAKIEGMLRLISLLPRWAVTFRRFICLLYVLKSVSKIVMQRKNKQEVCNSCSLLQEPARKWFKQMIRFPEIDREPKRDGPAHANKNERTGVKTKCTKREKEEKRQIPVWERRDSRLKVNFTRFLVIGHDTTKVNAFGSYQQ